MNKDFAIVIPTYKRSDILFNKANTLDYMEKDILDKTWLNIRIDEFEHYDKVITKYPGIGSIVYRDQFGIPKTRDNILHDCNNEYLIMIDDDIRFASRNKNKYTPLSKPGFTYMINDMISHCTSLCPIVGITARQFSNNLTEPIKENTRIIQVYCLHMPTIHKEGVKFSDADIPFMTDYYFTIKHLTLGYKNKILTEYTRDDNMQTPGGCATYRTVKLCNQSAIGLSKLFPDIVKPYYKESGTWEEKRINVRVQWKKAFNEIKYKERVEYDKGQCTICEEPCKGSINCRLIGV